jgi:hypothetical protein
MRIVSGIQSRSGKKDTLLFFKNTGRFSFRRRIHNTYCLAFSYSLSVSAFFCLLSLVSLAFYLSLSAPPSGEARTVTPPSSVGPELLTIFVGRSSKMRHTGRRMCGLSIAKVLAGSPSGMFRILDPPNSLPAGHNSYSPTNCCLLSSPFCFLLSPACYLLISPAFFLSISLLSCFLSVSCFLLPTVSCFLSFYLLLLSPVFFLLFSFCFLLSPAFCLLLLSFYFFSPSFSCKLYLAFLLIG